MCAIVSSSNKETFKELLKHNNHRGTFASSLIKIDQKSIDVHKSQGLFDENLLDSEGDKLFVGHVQAPTSDVREWSKYTSHPFESEEWLVIHNGVLTNHKELDLSVKVDTQCIVNMLQNESEQTKDSEGNCIKSVCDKLKGTFALFIVNKKTHRMYILRQGSLLHYNDSGDVSSLRYDGMKLLPEGTILKYHQGKWSKHLTFTSSSPFLFL